MKFFFTNALILFLLSLTIYTSCTKPLSSPLPIPVDTLPLPPADTSTFSVDNKWQCVIDGISYSGIVDTSFMRIVFPYYDVDSVIVCTGSSLDKKVQVHFKVTVDRKKFPGSGVNNNSNTYLVFDTSANNLFVGSASSATERVYYQLDTMVGNNLKISFTGMVTDQHFTNHTISGNFSCRLNTGDNDPNKFYCLIDNGNVKRDGLFTNAILTGNTLEMLGLDYMDFPFSQFRLAIRVGGTIKPGIYKSSNGDIAFSTVPPQSSPGYYYIDDSIGNMTVNIQSVNGNIVRGSFSGTDQTFNNIDSGTFTCRVANYIPQTDAATRWQFGSWVNPSFGRYHSFAGNTTGAERTKVNGTSYLTVNGESDNGASKFKIVISSLFSPIVPGRYELSENYDQNLDTFYFKSAIPAWDEVLTVFQLDRSVYYLGARTACIIDTIDDRHVKGTLIGSLYGNIQAQEIHRGSFSADF